MQEELHIEEIVDDCLQTFANLIAMIFALENLVIKDVYIQPLTM